jgi:hypothetical protein
MNAPYMNPETHRLTNITTGPKHPLYCQNCGRQKNMIPKAFPLTRWQEHDHRDQPENKIVVLCQSCSDKIIEPHPRLYTALAANAPWPGCMELCLDCKWRDGVSCSHPDAKANGGAGVMLTIAKPHVAMVDGTRNGRRWGGPMRLWPTPASACKQKESLPNVG